VRQSPHGGSGGIAFEQRVVVDLGEPPFNGRRLHRRRERQHGRGDEAGDSIDVVRGVGIADCRLQLAALATPVRGACAQRGRRSRLAAFELGEHHLAQSPMESVGPPFAVERQQEEVRALESLEDCR
jgi:hypothetical protein